CSHNLAQMSFDFFEFDAVSQYLNLIIDPTQVVKRSRRILVSQISRAIPSASLQRGKASPSKLVILEVSARHLPARHDQFPVLALWQEIETRVHDAGADARQRLANSQRTAMSGDIWRIFKALCDAVNRHLGWSVKVFHNAVRGGNLPCL